MRSNGRGDESNRGSTPDFAEGAGRDMQTGTEAEVTAVEAHPKQPGMYRVWIRVPDGAESMLQDADNQDRQADIEARGTGRQLRRDAIEKSRRQQEDPPEDWHAEVDSWLQEAVHAANRGEPNEHAITVHEDTLVSMRLLKGKRLSPEEWQQLRREEALEEAYRAALAIVERKARTSRELGEALKRKGYSAEAIAGCLQRMQSRRLLDDSAYARRFAEQRTAGQRKGRHLVRQELVQRGISREEADRAIGELDDRVEIEAANALARKKWPQLKGELRERRMKLRAFLMRRGFPSGIVRTALEHVQAGAEPDEDDGFA